MTWACVKYAYDLQAFESSTSLLLVLKPVFSKEESKTYPSNEATLLDLKALISGYAPYS